MMRGGISGKYREIFSWQKLWQRKKIWKLWWWWELAWSWSIILNWEALKGESNSLSYTYGYTDIRKYGSIRFSKFEIVSPLLKPLLFAHDIWQYIYGAENMMMIVVIMVTSIMISMHDCTTPICSFNMKQMIENHPQFLQRGWFSPMLVWFQNDDEDIEDDDDDHLLFSMIITVSRCDIWFAWWSS